MESATIKIYYLFKNYSLRKRDLFYKKVTYACARKKSEKA